MGKGCQYEYSDPDKFVVVNVDPDLIPIKIYTPKPPPLDLIDGYGLEPSKQMFHRAVMPKRLLEIEKNCDYDIEKIWDYIEVHARELHDEIYFIKKQWYHRLNGYWFFNNGKPTYITGSHYYYINWYRIDVGYPKYRKRDRSVFIFKDFCLKDTYDFVDKDKDGRAIPDEEGFYHFRDTGKRVCFGDVYVKYRREGATYKCTSHGTEIITRTHDAQFGIQSRNDKDARKVFTKKIIPAFKKLPFFFKPEYSSSTDPKKELIFDKQSSTAKKSVSTVETGLQSSIDYEVGDEGAYDGQKLHYKFDDEEGKNTLNDVWQRHLVAKECLSEDFGGTIIGYNSKASTAGEMEYGGGEQFKKECDSSNFYQRNGRGQTLSGCYLLFINSTSGIDTDIYGDYDAVENEKTILDTRAAYLRQDPPDLVGWCEKVRQYPILYRECFNTSSTDVGFDIQKISVRMDELRMTRNNHRQGNFVREVPGNRESKVRFVDDANGKFIITLEPEAKLTNRMQMINGSWYPYASKFTAGGDPFRMSNTEGNKMSNGGGSVFYDRDYELDPPGKDPKDWTSVRFVCTYCNRTPTTDEYIEDMLMMCQFYGAPICAESNVANLIEKFTEWGFHGYLLYLYNADGTLRNTPGVHAGADSQQQLMLRMRNHIAAHCHRERHFDLLDQCMKIPNIKKLTEYDLLTACGWALYGSEKGCKDHLSAKIETSYDPYNILNYVTPVRRTA
jgi:hypothetical protein